MPILAEAALVVVTLAAIASLGRLFDSTELPRAARDHRARRPRRRDRPAPDPARTDRGRPRRGGGGRGGPRLDPLPRHHLPRPARARARSRSPARTCRDAWTQFGEVVAPAPGTARLRAAARASRVWVAAWVADWAAFRLGSAVEAVLAGVGDRRVRGAAGRGPPPHLDDRGLHRRRPRLRPAAPGGRPGRRPAPGWATAGARDRPAVVAVGLGMVVLAVRVRRVRRPTHARSRAPRRCSTGTAAAIGDGTRVTVSPLVDIRKRLVDQSDVEAFTVRADRRSYWRLTALDEFDGTVWSSSGSFGEADGDLPGRLATARSTPIVQDFAITGLQAIWLPAAYQPVDVQHQRHRRPLRRRVVDPHRRQRPRHVRRRATTGSPPRSPSSTSSCSTRTTAPTSRPRSAPATSRCPTTSPSRSRTCGRSDHVGRARTPTSGPACSRTGSATSSPTTSSGVRAGHSEDAIETFLESRRGYCEQFAGTFAAMARSRASPPGWRWASRPGEVDEDSDGTRYIVRGRNAHAWPEVWINQAGWVPFEPTPGRGAPGAEEWTGVTEAAGRPGPDRHHAAPVDRQHRDHPDDPARPDAGQGPDEVDSVGARRRRAAAVRCRRSCGSAIAVGVAVLAVAAWVGLLAAARAAPDADAPPPRHHRGRAGAAGLARERRGGGSRRAAAACRRRRTPSSRHGCGP